MTIIVYDLDGTLRNVTCAHHLVPEDKSNPVNWAEWQHYVNEHGTVLPVCVDYECAVVDASILDYEVYILTSSQFGTRKWLDNKYLPQPNKVIERDANDGRHPVQYKKDWLADNAHDVVKWVDDNQGVCDYVRKTYPHIEVVQVTYIPNIGYETIHSIPEEAVTDTPLSRFIKSSTSTKDEMMTRVIDRLCEEQNTTIQPNKVIIFNGPPHAGKDLATEFCCAYFNGTHHSLKTPLIKLTAASLGITVEEFLAHYDDKCDDKTHEESGCVWVKDLPMYQMNGEHLSKRQALIHVSENVIKPTFGDDIFGKLAANTLPEGVVFFSDGGFPDEVQPLADKVGIDNILIVHIHRDGCTFEGDSRDYVDLDGVKTVTVKNGLLGTYIADIARVVGHHLGLTL